MLDFSVIGLGSVGWAVVHGLHSKGFTYSGYDIVGKHDWSKILESKVTFICSSTPSGQDGRLDCSSVKDILSKLDKDGYSGVVVVKSTVSVGFMNKASEEFPALHLVYMPEFLRERSCYTWFLEPDRLVVSGALDDLKAPLSLFNWVPEEKVVHADFITAEIGKLAHNSYIATKVSFTNEIEEICERYGANPNGAMEIVWKDRRVNCSDHLTPGLGPYGGKCVVKDMEELMWASDGHLLRTVSLVNGLTTAEETRPIYPDVAVIIPTNHEIEYLSRALESLIIQTYKPRMVVVVSDQSNDDSAKIDKCIGRFTNQLPIVHIQNSKEQNVSGAINSGLDYLSNGEHIDDDMFIALLDDDDWWEHRYLENCVKFSYEQNSDWIISGLIRYDENNPQGKQQPIPMDLDVSDFLVGNPNVQNSNLFVRANKFISVGGYDANLVSTTDRDTSIRLLQAETKYSILFNHLVHHDAYSRPRRLSHPGSERKNKGLSTFYRKYNSIMTEEQRKQFKNRAKKLFNIDIDERS